jgi:antiviral helicase SKI2
LRITDTPTIQLGTELGTQIDTTNQYPYARQLDINVAPGDYASLRLSKTYPFALDIWQQHAIVALERGESVFIAAHTSAG